MQRADRQGRSPVRRGEKDEASAELVLCLVFFICAPSANNGTSKTSVSQPRRYEQRRITLSAKSTTTAGEGGVYCDALTILSGFTHKHDNLLLVKAHRQSQEIKGVASCDLYNS